MQSVISKKITKKEAKKNFKKSKSIKVSDLANIMKTNYGKKKRDEISSTSSVYGSTPRVDRRVGYPSIYVSALSE